MSFKYACIAILSVALWGVNFVTAKIALLELDVFMLITMRFLVVACLLIPFFPKMPARPALLLLIAFVFSVLHIGANYVGMALGLDAGMATLVEQINAPFLLILSVIFFKEKVGIRSLAGIALSFIGTFILLQAPTSVETPLGFFFIVVGAFFWGVYSLLLRQIEDTNPLAVVAWISLFAVPITACLSFLLEGDHVQKFVSASMNAWLGFFYTVFAASIMSHGMWFYLLKRVPIQQLAPTTLLVPLFGVLAGVILLDEQVAVHMVVGGAVMLLGVAIVIIRRPKVIDTDIDA